MTDKNPIVVMKGITIEFPGVKALDGVDLTLYPGEVHALMGENGAGKSTMIKALTGVYKINAGSIMVDGKPQQFNGTLDAQNAGIATVYQEVNLCTNLSVGENVMLGHEKRGPFGIDWKKTHEAAKKYLAQMGLESIDPHTPLSSISIAMQQLVAIARAMVINAKVLILDEPTSSLDANEVKDLFAIMRKVRDSGVAILFVSHFLDQIYEITDRLTILRNGQFIKEVMTKDTPRDELIGMMLVSPPPSCPRLVPRRLAVKSPPARSRSSMSRASARRAPSTRLMLTSTRVRSLASLACWAPVVPSLVDSCMVPTSRIRVPTRSTARRSTSPIRTRL